MGAALVLLVLSAGYRLLTVADDLREARDGIRAAAVQIEAGRLADAQATLDEVQDRLVGANASLSNAPDLNILGLLPVVRQNIESLRGSVRVALELVAGGSRVLAGTEDLQTPEGDLEIPLRQGAIPVGAVLEAQRDLDDLGWAVIESSADLPSRLLLPPIADLQREIHAEAGRRLPQIASLSNALGLVGEMLGGNGDRRYLVAVANTAEMRGSGGMYLSYGLLESSGGDLDMTAFGNIDEIFLANGVDPVTLDVPEDELARWPGLAPTRLWRNVNLIPEFSVVAPRAAAMFQAATGRPVDGVIQIDPGGLAALLEGTGPVDVPTVGVVTAENVVALTLNEAYTLFPDRDQRQEVLGDVAEAVLRRLVDGEYESLRPLGEAVAEAVAQRHLLLWSGRPAAQAPMAYFAANGPLPTGDATDYLLLTTQNRGRDKLDYYLDSAVSITGERPEGEAAVVDVEVTFTNGAPPGVTEPAYVFGGDVIGEVALGTYTGIASLYVPNGTTLVPSDAVDAAEAVLQPEGGRTVIGWPITIAAGASETLRVQLRLPPRPPGTYGFGLVPVPRVRPTSYTVSIADGDGRRLQRSGPLEELEVLTFG